MVANQCPVGYNHFIAMDVGKEENRDRNIMLLLFD